MVLNIKYALYYYQHNMPTKKASLLRRIRLNSRAQISTNVIKSCYWEYGRILIRRIVKQGYPIEVKQIGRMKYYRYKHPKDYTRLYILGFALLLGIVWAIISR